MNQGKTPEQFALKHSLHGFDRVVKVQHNGTIHELILGKDVIEKEVLNLINLLKYDSKEKHLRLCSILLFI